MRKYLFKEATIKMRACRWAPYTAPTPRAIHSFDDFIWSRELSALAIMHYCLPFDSASSTARATPRRRETAAHTATPTTQHAFHKHSPSRSNARRRAASDGDRNYARIKQVVEEIIIIFTTSHSIQHLVTILRAHCTRPRVVVKSFLYWPVSLIVRL